MADLRTVKRQIPFVFFLEIVPYFIFFLMTDKRTVSIKRTVTSFYKRFLLSVPYHQNFGGLNCLRTGTLNRKHRVQSIYVYYVFSMEMN